MEQVIEKKKGFAQVCVWPGTVVGSSEIEKFEKFMLDEFGVRVQYLEEITRNPIRTSQTLEEGTISFLQYMLTTLVSLLFRDSRLVFGGSKMCLLL